MSDLLSVRASSVTGSRLMQELVSRVERCFQAEYRYRPTLLVQAPGRVNLIGEHTDYTGGFVLPCAINKQIVVAAARRNDSIVRVIALDFGGEPDEFDLLEDIVFDHGRLWVNYVRGSMNVLKQKGYQFDGADIVLSGNVPQGAGLSSSAALEVAIGQSFNALHDLGLDKIQIAKNAQQAEIEFVGCHCGIMDQIVSAKGEANHALLIDCRSLEIRPVPMPQDASVLIIDSNKRRDLVNSEYNLRREQCERAARYFGARALRDVDIEQLEHAACALGDLLTRRARHVITENQRTLQAAYALRANDLPLVGRLMAASHASMRADFEITVPEIDLLVEIVSDVIGESGGVRMTGGGFGGCVVSLLPTDGVDEVKAAVEKRYEQSTGLKETVFVSNAAKGASLVQCRSNDSQQLDQKGH